MRELSQEEKYKRLEWVLKEVRAWVVLFKKATITTPIGFLILLFGVAIGFVFAAPNGTEIKDILPTGFNWLLGIYSFILMIFQPWAEELYRRAQFKWRERTLRDIHYKRKKWLFFTKL